MSSKVLYQREDHVVTITINRPEVMNAIDGETAAALVKAWQAFRDDDEAFVAIITGTGDRAFSAGADLKWVASLGGLRANVDRQRVSLYNSPGAVGYTRGVDIFKPTIAAVNGYCFAGGFETALWCDIRIAAEHAEFGMLNRRWNVPSIDGCTVRLPRIVGLGRALDLLITGRRISAREALDMGLVSEVVPLERLIPRCRELAATICSFPQGALRSDKEALLLGLGRPLEEGYRIEAELGATLQYRSVTPSEGARAFAEHKRMPEQWKDHGL